VSRDWHKSIEEEAEFDGHIPPPPPVAADEIDDELNGSIEDEADEEAVAADEERWPSNSLCNAQTAGVKSESWELVEC
jgi:hypothetical protein